MKINMLLLFSCQTLHVCIQASFYSKASPIFCYKETGKNLYPEETSQRMMRQCLPLYKNMSQIVKNWLKTSYLNFKTWMWNWFQISPLAIGSGDVTIFTNPSDQEWRQTRTLSVLQTDFSVSYFNVSFMWQWWVDTCNSPKIHVWQIVKITKLETSHFNVS